MVTVQEQLRAFTRDAVEAEARTNWARLRRVPSTYTWRAVDYILTLKPDEQGTLFNAFSENAPSLFYPGLGSARLPDPALLKFAEELLQRPSSHIPTRLLRGMVASMRSDGPNGPLANLSHEILKQAESIHPTSASEIRKEVKEAFSQHFRAKPHNLGGGNWNYPGDSAGRPFTLTIDYGGQVDQLRYWVEFQDPRTGLHPRMLTYEGLVGVGFGRWDFVTADNLHESIQLLQDLVRDLVAIPDRLVPSAPGG